MEEYQEVFFTEDKRVVAGTRIVRFEAHKPRRVHPDVVRTALGLGAQIAPGPLPEVQQEAVSTPPPQEGEPDFVGPEKPKIKKRRTRRKKRPEADIIANAVEYMTAEQPSWQEIDYDLNKLPRMHLFQKAVPDLTPSLREAAWDIFISGQRNL